MVKFACRAFAALILVVVNGFAIAQTAMIDRFVPEAALVGEARFKVLLFPIYDASLYAPGGDYRKSGPLALELHYLIDVEKERIVNQTVKTFKRRKLGSHADVAKWRKIVGEHFSDVQKGDRITVAFPDLQTVVFSTNGSEPTVVSDIRFAEAFKDLWLGDNVRNKSFQNKLLGLK